MHGEDCGGRGETLIIGREGGDKAERERVYRSGRRKRVAGWGTCVPEQRVSCPLLHQQAEPRQKLRPDLRLATPPMLSRRPALAGDPPTATAAAAATTSDRH